MIVDLENRFMHHPPKDEYVADLHDKIRDLYLTLAKEVLFLTPESREQSLAITKLEEAMFWSNAAISRKLNN